MSNDKKLKKSEEIINAMIKAVIKDEVAGQEKWKKQFTQKASDINLADIDIPQSISTGLDLCYQEQGIDNVSKKMFDPFIMPKNKKNSIGQKTLEPIEIEKMDDNDMVLPSNENDVEMIRQSLIIERISERMRIIAVAIDTESDNNEINLIHCHGEPIGCYAYDAQNDGYYVNCMSYVDLGPISVAYRIKSQGKTETNNVIALPDDLIEKYLGPNQKKALKVFREKYAAPRYSISYMQSIVC